MARFVAAVVAALVVGVAIGWAVHAPSPAPVHASAPSFAEGPGHPIATFDGGALTDEELKGFLLTRPEHEEVDRAAHEAVHDELFSAAAISRGVDRDPSVAARLKRELAKAYVEQDLNEYAKKSATDEPGLKAYYDAHRAEFARPERIDIDEAEFMLPLEPEARKKVIAAAHKFAKDVAGKDGAVFRKLGEPQAVIYSRIWSKDELASSIGGDNATDAWLMVKLNDVRLYEFPNRVVVLRLEGREPAVDETFEQAKPTVMTRRWYELRSAELKRLDDETAKALGLKVDDAAVKKVIASSPGY